MQSLIGCFLGGKIQTNPNQNKDVKELDLVIYDSLALFSSSEIHERFSYRWYDCDEELGAVGVGPSIGHANCVWSIVSQIPVKFILKFTTPDRFPSSTIP